MFKALLKVRFLSFLSSLSGGGKNRRNSSKSLVSGKGRVFLVIFLLIYIFGVFGFLFYNLFGQLFDAFYNIDQLWFFYLLVMFFAFLLAFIGSILMTQSQLYNSTDNEMLLSMPIKPSAILLSRIVSLYLTNLVMALLPMGTCLIVSIVGFNKYGTSMSAMQIIVYVLMLLTVPILSLVFSLLLGFLVALVSSKMRNKTLVSIILTILFLIAYMYAINSMQEFINYMMTNGAALADKFNVLPAYIPGAAIAKGDIIYFLISFGVVLVLFLIVYAVLSATFIKIATTKKGAKKKKYVEKELKTSGVRVALLKKELSHFFKNSAYVLNGLSGNLMLVIFAVLFFVKSDVLDSIGSLMAGGDNPVADMIPMIVLITLVFTSGFNIVSAPSISVEAKTLWITRSMPVSTKDILEAKAMLHFVICEPFSLVFALAVGIFLKVGVLQMITLIVLPCVYNLFNAYFGVYVNLKHPKLDWINETQAIKQSASVMITMFANMGIIVSFGIIYMFLLRDVLQLDIYLLIVAAVMILVTLLIKKYFSGVKAEKKMAVIS